MRIHLHQTHNQLADFKGVYKELKQTLSNGPKGLHLYPELFLTGYPLQDLCLQLPFIEAYGELLKKINSFSKSLEANPEMKILLGALDYEFQDAKHPHSIKNIMFEISPGEELKKIYTKQLLPNYDIFDERKYFHPGSETGTIEFNDLKIGLLICEDMWPSSFYKKDPVRELEKISDLDLAINLSASPFHISKHEARLQRASEISNRLKIPFYYVNRVGGEDEILFDGRSFAVDGDRLIGEASKYEKDLLELDYSPRGPYRELEYKNLNTWENLFKENLTKQNPSSLNTLSDNELDEIIEALNFGVQEYARKNGFSKFLVALSGGIDSSLVLTLLKLGLKQGQEIEALYMPGIYSAGISHDLSRELAKNLNIPLKVLPIKFLHSTCRNAFSHELGSALEGLADENIQSRLRGTLLYARSNQTNAMVINTSNKSEIAVGYSTQYGDSVGAISMLGDLYKTEVFSLTKYINRKYGNLIPEGIITRSPSAELRAEQKDEDSLPPYKNLDAILEGLLTYRFTVKELEEKGFSRQEIEKTVNLYTRSEYKRSQFCPIIKVKSKSFGCGYRVPLTKASDFYLHTLE